jgi:putative transposase
MPRSARIIIPGYLHHITQRGNNRQRVFFEENDYILYLKRIEEYARKFQISIHAYCLMPNHVHFILEPEDKKSIGKMFQGVNTRYVKYINKKTSNCGHIWQGRYYSCILQGTHIHQAIRYVEQNPVRADMVRRARDYAWSSARAHLGTDYKWITLADPSPHLDIISWHDFLDEGEDRDFIKDIRKCTHRNTAIGDERFIDRLEDQLGRRIRPARMGRPRKQ